MSAGEGIAAFIVFLAAVYGGCALLLLVAVDPGEAAPTDATPDYRGRCRCRACRERPQEPCSDFSGD